MPIGPKPSYIQKASTPTIALTNKIPSDNRLFVRINQMHPARSAGSFAILTALKKVLGPNASLLREVQEVKTGFALCTSSTANLLALEKQKAIISSAIGDCKIEAQEKWTTYRLNYVPKKVTIFNDQFKIDSILVTKDTISDAIKEYSGQVLTHAIQSQTNPLPNEYYSTWIHIPPSTKTKDHSMQSLLSMAQRKNMPQITNLPPMRFGKAYREQSYYQLWH
ncbi:predicted protein [Sclerotinia sclerotiorum 1980 UF-70]|uniref:Uncharacterized protein n=1 Tax=Sclerotinia sclerotiorum (strain ATCC 18683 / 1980 / Ss-1) TaxID=665079 RepID=A7F8F5_SCLS1|nr:predicted protein [Sclerotinia sclerotiorum 1980 UF-70]EDN99026.1 predicted protein [Sclerotinia sclerotiorum 1980 UF-70]